MEILKLLEKCELCPRKCGVNRLKGEIGYCRAGSSVKVARAMLHNWEEPCISCGNGSGAVFFSNCNLSCVFCQNSDISQSGSGREITIERLSDIYIELQSKGASNINLVSPTHYIPQVIASLEIAKSKGLNLPIVYNTNGYENVDILKYLDGIVDVYLPDIKYHNNKYALKYSKAPDYFKYASAAILEMFRQVGTPLFEGDMIKKGLIIRHLLLPGQLSESKKILDWISENLPKDTYVSLMSQYVPVYKAVNYPEINKKVSSKSYEWLIDYFLSIGLENGFTQEYSSAESVYTPEFNLDGV
jgi:putative pyruvate formate lyase activating enzyme